MPRTIRTKVYKFNELSKQAKAKAIEEYRESHAFDEFSEGEEYIKSMEEFADLFNLTLGNWSIGGRGEAIPFEFNFDHEEIEEFTSHRLAKYIWNNYGHKLYKGKYFSLWSKTEKSYKHYKDGYPVLKSRDSKVIKEGRNCVLTGVCTDEDLLDNIYNFLEKPDERNFKDLVEDCFEALIKAYNEERDSQSSDEYIIDQLENGDQLYTRAGKEFNY